MENSQALKDGPFACDVCQRTYGRHDHLARHYRTHTNEKPFKCPECGKAFARADLQKRHAAIHSTNDPDTRPPKSRVSQACAGCASVKLKCDAVRPCRRCQSKGIFCQPINNTPPSYGQRASSPTQVARNFIPPDRPTGLGPPPGYNAQFIQPVLPLKSPPTTRQQPIAGPLGAGLAPDTSLRDFLKEVLGGENADSGEPGQGVWEGPVYKKDVLDFSQDLNLDNDFWMEDWGAWLDPALATVGCDGSTPSISDSINMSSEAFQRSSFRWAPNGEGAMRNELNLAIYPQTHYHRPHGGANQQSLTPRLDHRSRDRMLAMLLRTCKVENYEKIVSAFPAETILDSLLNNFLRVHRVRLDAFIHIPTFDPAQTIPELLAVMVASGAASSPMAEVQKFGYALQETCRLALRLLDERDSSMTQSIQALQASAISLEVDLWSGDHRNMVLAESHSMLLLTKLRRRGLFRRSRQHIDAPSTEDSPPMLEHKWHAWTDMEGWKRLAYKVQVFYGQMSMALFSPPLVSYGEVTLDLPSRRDLWTAQSAAPWRDVWNAFPPAVETPSLIQCIYSIERLTLIRQTVDMGLTHYLLLLSHWVLVWEYRSLETTVNMQDTQWAGVPQPSVKCKELKDLLDRFGVILDGWGEPPPPEVDLVAQLVRMNLCVSFDDVQLFAGRAGEEEARRVLPSLRTWVEGSQAREAVFHAGQVVRAARRKRTLGGISDPYWLRDFNAVVFYQTGLALFVYGLLVRSAAVHAPSPADGTVVSGLFCLDGRKIPLVDRNRFISLNQGGIPAISNISPPSTGGEGTDVHAATETEPVPLRDPKRVMDLIADILRTQSSPLQASVSGHQAKRPAIVENLIQLMQDLGVAAS